MKPQSLFEKYGGFARINQIVMAFYDVVLDSEQIGQYFEDVDMKRLIDHQTKFVSGLLGGPVELDDQRLAKAHAHLHLTQADFDEMKRLFGETLAEHGFDPPDVDEVLTAIEVRRSVVVT